MKADPFSFCSQPTLATVCHVLSCLEQNLAWRIQPNGLSVLSVNRFRTVVAVLLLALWVPMSSHDLLEDLGLIHTTASTDAGDNHDAADGLCQLPQGAFQVQVSRAPQVS